MGNEHIDAVFFGDVTLEAQRNASVRCCTHLTLVRGLSANLSGDTWTSPRVFWWFVVSTQVSANHMSSGCQSDVRFIRMTAVTCLTRVFILGNR